MQSILTGLILFVVINGTLYTDTLYGTQLTHTLWKTCIDKVGYPITCIEHAGMTPYETRYILVVGYQHDSIVGVRLDVQRSVAIYTPFDQLMYSPS